MDPNNSYGFIDKQNSDNQFILLSAPHCQQTYRHTDEEGIHRREVYTGAIVRYMNDKLGCPVIYKRYRSDDPNYYDFIPKTTQTQAFNNIHNNLIPYKEKIKDYLLESSNIYLVIDIHGKENDTRGNIEIGTMNKESLQSNVACYIPDIMEYIFLKYGMDNIITNSIDYSAENNQTITKYVIHSTNREIDAVQMEITRKYRGASSDIHLNFINAFSEIIYVINQLYSIYSQPA